jgi:hypothetical protein
MVRLALERVDQEPVEADLGSEALASGDPADRVALAVGARAVWDLVWAQDPVVWDLVLAQDPEALAVEVRAVWGLVWDQDLADQAAADQAAVCKQPALGLELATMAAQLWFRESSLVFREEPLVDEASRQKKNFSGFSGR